MLKKSNENNILLLSMFTMLMLTIALVGIVSAQDTQDNIANRSIGVQPTVEVKEEKFRVEPKVRIRPLSDVINKSTDGLIEIYLENPGINDVLLTAEINITAPSGIDVYGQGFGDDHAPGISYVKIEVPPGNVRIAYINIKSEKTGNFYVQLSGTYYPGENKGNHKSLSLIYPFIVYELSPDPKELKLTNPSQIPDEGNWWNDKIVPGLIMLIVAGLIGLGYRIVEIKYHHRMEIKNRIAKSKVTEKVEK